MSEDNISNNNNTNEITKKENLFYLTIPEMTNINKLLSYGYKLVDETDKDIQQYLKKKRIQEKKLKNKYFQIILKEINSVINLLLLLSFGYI